MPRELIILPFMNPLYSNLKGKTIFDICTDLQLLSKFTGVDIKYLDNARRNSVGFDEDSKINQLWRFSSYTNDNELSEALHEQFPDYFASIFNE